MECISLYTGEELKTSNEQLPKIKTLSMLSIGKKRKRLRKFRSQSNSGWLSYSPFQEKVNPL